MNAVKTPNDRHSRRLTGVRYESVSSTKIATFTITRDQKPYPYEIDSPCMPCFLAHRLAVRSPGEDALAHAPHIFHGHLHAARTARTRRSASRAARRAK